MQFSKGLNQRSAKYGLSAKSVPPPVFINENSLGHGHVYSFTYRLGLLLLQWKS